MKIDRNDWLAFLFFVFITLIFFHSFLDGSKVFGYKDFSRYFYPLRYIMVEQVKTGTLPLWNPYIFSGYPFLATLQICFFYPISIIHYLLPFHLAFNYYTIIHYFLAAWFTYLLMRHYKVSRPAAIISGLTFAFSGYLLSVSCMNTTLTSVVWLPLVVLCYDKIINGTAMPWHGCYSLLLVIALAFMFLGGEPTILYMTFLILFAYGICFGATKKGRILNKRQCALALIISLLLALLLCAVQLFPFIEMAKYSDRTLSVSYEGVSSCFLPIRETVNFILPFFWGNVLVPGRFPEYLLGVKCQQWLLSIYLGFIPLFFAVVGVIHELPQPQPRLSRKTWFWGGVGVLGLLLAFGPQLPFYNFFYQFLPGFSLIRHPIKFIFMFVFSISLLSGFGFAKLCAGVSRRTVWFSGGTALFLMILSVAGNIFKRDLFMFCLSKTQITAFRIQIIENIIGYNLQSLFLITITAIVLTIVLYLFIFKKLSQQIFGIAIISILVLDLLSAGGAVNLPLDRKVYEKITPNIGILTSDKSLFRYYQTPELCEHSYFLNAENKYEEELLSAKDKLAANQPLLHGLYELNGYESVILNSHKEFYTWLNKLDFEQRLKILGLLNVKYIFSLKHLDSSSLKYIKHTKYAYEKTYAYLNKLWRPRAYMISSLEGFSAPLPAIVTIKKYTSNRVAVQTDCREKGFLFLSDSYFPGWKTYVDGKETRIFKANNRFRAAALEPGKHNVIFSYEPASFKWGAAISLVTIVGLALTLFPSPRGRGT